jgi:hypothetical protein
VLKTVFGPASPGAVTSGEPALLLDEVELNGLAEAGATGDCIGAPGPVGCWVGLDCDCAEATGLATATMTAVATRDQLQRSGVRFMGRSIGLGTAAAINPCAVRPGSSVNVAGCRSCAFGVRATVQPAKPAVKLAA